MPSQPAGKKPFQPHVKLHGESHPEANWVAEDVRSFSIRLVIWCIAEPPYLAATVQVVNVGHSSQRVTVTVDGARFGGISEAALRTVISGPHAEAENSFDAPLNVRAPSPLLDCDVLACQAYRQNSKVMLLPSVHGHHLSERRRKTERLTFPEILLIALVQTLHQVGINYQVKWELWCTS